MSQLSDFLAAGQSTYGAGRVGLKAGATIAQNDVVLLAGDRLAYPAETADYAAKPTIGDSIAGASLGSSASGGPTSYDRYSIVRADNGDIYMGSGATSNPAQGMAVYRYSAGGTLLGYTEVDSFAAQCYEPHMVQLSNGNLAVIYSNGINIKYAVVSPTLAIVKAATTIEGIHSNQKNSLVALPGGGFLTIWQKGGAGAQHRVAVYDNSGTVVTAANTFYTWPSAQDVSANLAVLSNGQIAFVAGAVTTTGIFAGTFMASGAVSVAITSIFAGTNCYDKPNLSVLTGFFALSIRDNTSGQVKAMALTNNCAVQGSVFASNCGGDGMRGSTLANDGVDFWMSYVVGTGSIFPVVKLTTAGVSTTFSVAGYSTGMGGLALDSFWEKNRLVVAYNSPTEAPKFFVFNTVSLLAESISISSGGATDIGDRKIIPGGDFSFLYCNYVTSIGVVFGGVKYMSTAIIGVATAATVAGSQVALQPSAGAYTCNPLKGGASKAFDHTAATLIGNKGVVYAGGGLILKGVV